MLSFNIDIEQILMVLPIVAIHFGLAIFSIIKILKEGVEILSKTIRILLVVFINLFGPILFLIIGRKRDSYDTCE